MKSESQCEAFVLVKFVPQDILLLRRKNKNRTQVYFIRTPEAGLIKI